jgi:hypothetical protein
MLALAAAGAGTPPIQFGDRDDGYRAGACNIGKDEINRRWRFGHAALVSAVILFGALLVADAAPIVRALVGVPAAVAAACYLEAYLKFCIRFGWLGRFNFGSYGATQRVTDGAARSADRRRSLLLSAVCAVVLVVVAAVAVALPV